MKLFNAILFFTFLFPSALFSQDEVQVREYNLNKDEPGAVYAFTFVHLTDIHVGEGQGDFGTPGFLDDTMPEGDVGYSAVRLRRAVNWINEHATANDIQFVLVTGDITDSGERSEFEKAKEILDVLEIPYVPTIGNHDIWPYVRFQEEAEYAYGDSVMNEVFKDTYDKAASFFDNWDDGTRLQRVYNPESRHEHYHQNFSFSYQGFGFLAFDFNPRYHVRKEEPGVGAEARLNDFEGGTFPWLLQTIENYPIKKQKNLILLTHQPPHRDISALFNGLPLVDNDRLTRSLEKYREHLGLWLAGHVHRNMNYSMRTIGGGVKVIDVRETAANKEYENGLFTLIHVYRVQDPTSVKENIKSNYLKIYPNPVQNDLSIQLKENAQIQKVQIYNANGEVVYSEILNSPTAVFQTYKLPAGNLPSGVYFVQLIGNESIYTGKFVKTGI